MGTSVSKPRASEASHGEGRHLAASRSGSRLERPRDASPSRARMMESAPPKDFVLFRYLVRYPWESGQYLLRRMASALKNKSSAAAQPSPVSHRNHRIRVKMRMGRRKTVRRSFQRHTPTAAGPPAPDVSGSTSSVIRIRNPRRLNDILRPVLAVNRLRDSDLTEEASDDEIPETGQPGRASGTGLESFRSARDPVILVYSYDDDNTEAEEEDEDDSDEYSGRRKRRLRRRRWRNVMDDNEGGTRREEATSTNDLGEEDDEDLLNSTDSDSDYEPPDSEESDDSDDAEDAVTSTTPEVRHGREAPTTFTYVHVEMGVGGFIDPRGDQGVSPGARTHEEQVVPWVESTVRAKNFAVVNTAVDFHTARQFGVRAKLKVGAPEGHGFGVTRRMLRSSVMNERPLKLPDGMDKVFSAQWLSGHQVVFSTKCSKIIVYDTARRSLETIPLLRRPHRLPHHMTRALARAGHTMSPPPAPPSSPSAARIPPQQGTAVNPRPLAGSGGSRGTYALVIDRMRRQSVARVLHLYDRLVIRHRQLTTSGIHALRINGRGDLLATGSEHSTDVAVYALPTFDPVFVGTLAHEDLIFDMTWIDERTFVSGSRDSTIALWSVSDGDLDFLNYWQPRNYDSDDDVSRDKDEECSRYGTSGGNGKDKKRRRLNSDSGKATKMVQSKRHRPCCDDEDEEEMAEPGVLASSGFRPPSYPCYPVRRPASTTTVMAGEKVRALCMSANYRELGVVTMNACFHTFDPAMLRQKHSMSLPHMQENVCVDVDEVKDYYVVGSKSHISFVDGRIMRSVDSRKTPVSNCGVRSLSHRENLTTIGTGNGQIFFYDSRARRYLKYDFPSQERVVLEADDVIKGFWVPLPESSAQNSPMVSYGNGSTGNVNPPGGDRVAEADANPGGGGGGGDLDLLADLNTEAVEAIGDLPLHYIDFLPAIYAHCFNETGTRLFSAGGPLQVGVRGAYAAIWQ